MPERIHVIADTNVYLHYRAFDQIPWSELVGGGEVVLVVPLALLEELDKKKNFGNSVISARAQSAITKIRAARRRASTDLAEVAPRLYVFVPVEMENHQRLSNVDDEILAAGKRLDLQDLRIATGDYSMEIRAEARGLGVILLSDELKLPSSDELDRRIRQLAEENARLKHQLPKLSIHFPGDASYLRSPALGRDVGPDARETLVNTVVNKVPSLHMPSGTRFGLMALGPSIEDIETFNQERDAWIDEVRSWADQEVLKERRRRHGITLDLFISNDGSATAEDVQVILSLPGDKMMFFMVEDLAVVEPPSPPKEPTSIYHGLSRLDIAGHGIIYDSRYADSSINPFSGDWERSEDGAARIRIDQIRHGEAQKRLRAPIVLANVDGAAIERGMGFQWTVTSVRPTSTATGILNIAPYSGR